MMPGRFDEITSHLTLDELCICISSEDEWAVRNTWFLLRAVVDEGLDYDLFFVLGFSAEFGIEMCALEDDCLLLERERKLAVEAYE